MTRFGLASLLLMLAAQDGNLDLKKALKDNVGTEWIYDDLDAAKALAKKTGKPILAFFR